jgi:hypothetical protein
MRVYQQRPAQIFALGPGVPETGQDPIPDDFPFEFRDAREDAKYKAAVCGRCVYALVHEINLADRITVPRIVHTASPTEAPALEISELA